MYVLSLLLFYAELFEIQTYNDADVENGSDKTRSFYFLLYLCKTIKWNAILQNMHVGI